MYSHILQKTRTKEEAQILANEVDMLLETVFHANEKDFENALNSQVRSWVANALRDVLEKEKFVEQQGSRGDSSTFGSPESLRKYSGQAQRVRLPRARALQGHESSVLDARVFLQGLKKELTKIRSVKIALAFEPSNAFIDELFSWMHGLVGDYTVLDVSYDPSIIGGFVVTFEGKYGDFSLKRKLSEVFEGKKEGIWRLVTD